jgi:hypothetical protein
LRTLPFQATSLFSGMCVVEVISFSFASGFTNRNGEARSIEPHESSKLLCVMGRDPERKKLWKLTRRRDRVRSEVM